MKITLLLLLNFSNGLVWLPIGSKSSLPNKPVPLKIANDNYVVWKNSKNQKWSVVRDACSHRLAPLSQGRIDDASGCIECPYHGWQFDENGKCVKIPQASGNEKGKNVNSVEIMETGDILWGRFVIGATEKHFDTKPNEIFPELDNVSHVITRELPYSFDFLVENFMDPAHIPFAHHGLQGMRSDGINIPMHVITNMNDSSKLEVSFLDRVRGKMRNGVVSFVSPCYYHFRVENNVGEQKKQLMVLITPVSPTNSRIHLAFMEAKVATLFPKWISHSFANQFLETDIWIHNCEVEVQRDISRSMVSNSETVSKTQNNALQSYDLPTTSDIGAKAWRKWYDRHMNHIPVFSNNFTKAIVELSPRQQKDRTSHIDSCIICQRALKRANLLRQFSLLFLLLPNRFIGVLGLVTSLKISNLMRKMVIGG
tara:strand:- start:6787 stop:8061 length:1275 start_codon:yes stop_codon:yes gene_type:complete